MQDPAQRIQHGRDKENLNNPPTSQKMGPLAFEQPFLPPSFLSICSQSNTKKQIVYTIMTLCVILSEAVVYLGPHYTTFPGIKFFLEPSQYSITDSFSLMVPSKSLRLPAPLRTEFSRPLAQLLDRNVPSPSPWDYFSLSPVLSALCP